ncbi:MAG TPA: ATP-binding protein, partial [Candidatus Acidoferrum sp.]|nr:ATP-binding protein [Candidatus Acidoferrum sp.]
MAFWKKSRAPSAPIGLPESVLRGANHEQLAQEALAELIATDSCDRAGVWLELAGEREGDSNDTLQGAVWDRENPTVPREWRALAPRRILPVSRLIAGAVTEIEPQSTVEPLVGVIAGLSKIAWVPVEHAGKLRGMVMTGANPPVRSLPIEQMKAVATKLAIALAYETERRFSNARHLDLVLCNRVLEAIGSARDLGDLLQELAESCLPRSGKPESPHAIFAAVMQMATLDEPSAGEPVSRTMAFAGEETNRAVVKSAGVQMLARRSLQQRQSVGEMVYGGSGNERLRVIAVPVTRTGESSEVLAAGFHSEAATLAALERMELRARLAGVVLNAMRQREADTRERDEQCALLEANSNGAVLLDGNGVILATNRAARLLLHMETAGEPARMAGGSNFSNCFSVAEQSAVINWLRGSGMRETSNGDLSDLTLPGGAKVKLQSRPLKERRQMIVLIPERSSLAEQETQVAELQNLAEWLDQGVVIYDREEKIRLANLRFAQLANLAPEELARLTSLTALIDRLQDHAAEPVSFAHRWRELARRQEGGDREEVHLVRPAARVLERASRPVLDRQGQRIGRIELYKDLTAQRVFHAKLLQTEKMAALGEMVSSVAHELSNPLTSILGYAQRLLVRGDGAQSFDDLRKIFAEAERAGAILRRILFASREAGPERRPVNLNQLVQRTIDLQRFRLAAERIRMELSLDALLPEVSGDAGQLQQVLINLLGNARQAIEAQGNGGTIRIRTESSPEGAVRLEVSDSGPGIPESILSRIFDPFFTTKPAGVGTGLGLSLVLSLVRDHGGQVHVASPRG